MKIIRGKTKPRGLRIVIYGVHGAGKTTLLSKLKDNLFLDFENGTHGLDVAKVAEEDLPKSYDEMKRILHELTRDRQGFRHLTIDTADKCELALSDALAREKGVEDIFAVNDYGRTVSVHKHGMASILDKATDLVNSGFDVIVLAHDTTRKCEPLEKNNGKTYDHQELKLSKSVTPLFTEWADVVIYVAFKTFIVDGEKGAKAQVEGGTRWAYCSYSNDFDAKHRACIDLPDDCSLDRLAKILPEAIENAVDRENGCKAEVSKEAEDAKETPKDAQETVSERSESKAVQPPERNAENVKEAVADFRKTLGQYGMSQEFVVGYPAVAKKFSERYGKKASEVPVEEWPDDFLKWVVRGITIEKIRK